MFPGGCAQNRDYGDIAAAADRLDSTARRRSRSAARSRVERLAQHLPAGSSTAAATVARNPAPGRRSSRQRFGWPERAGGACATRLACSNAGRASPSAVRPCIICAKIVARAAVTTSVVVSVVCMLLILLLLDWLAKHDPDPYVPLFVFRVLLVIPSSVVRPADCGRSLTEGRGVHSKPSGVADAGPSRRSGGSGRGHAVTRTCLGSIRPPGTACPPARCCGRMGFSPLPPACGPPAGWRARSRLP